MSILSSQTPVIISRSGARIYVEHDPIAPPPHPGLGWTRFVCISDNHSKLFPVPPGDVLIHAGDLSSWGYTAHLKTTTNWLMSMDHPCKIVTAGNHDLCLDPLFTWEGTGSMPPEELAAARELVKGHAALGANIRYLENEATEIEAGGRRWKIYASPASPLYAQGAFKYHGQGQATELWSRIPEDIDILITHTPPHDILDATRKGVKAGCAVLRSRLEDLPNCRLHVFGHIHEAHGVMIHGNIAGGERVFVNAALGSSLRRQAIIVDLLN
ncbi:Metallo-dependent phosphatase [Punctularia strigosozonata HHB-11173 SS5]|uniref:Metallo-dependent phosphatase n=1 Tax=Punctularia strigosozonata (strain HHB-11173) TaxID=741275 RepID=UPI0004417C91|nr:Metallo-dependent phosphatase [Punctularia strigosozonata HHB-11173 SS5]EIN07652.1 Metallo-dependent phosphatase [Punctularia strigosozonata HHB-11173 SS5]